MSNNNAREKFIALVKSNGWVLDPTSTVWSRYSAEGKKQDPWSYVRLAADGTGKWRIKLDYSVKGGYESTGNLLQSVELHYVPGTVEFDENGEPKEATRRRIDILTNSDRSKWSGTSYLWEALADDDRDLSLRQRAELLVKNPDLAAWLALEAKYQADERLHEDILRRREDRELRERPLPITVDAEEWWKLTYPLARVAKAIKDADGKSDLPALLEELRQVTAAVEAVVKVPVAQ